jgi:hypothetical protein
LLGFLGRILVGAGERHGGRIIVQLVEADLELLDHLTDDRHDQGGSDALEHAVEASAKAVVVQSWEVLAAQSEEVGREEGGPVSDAIDRLARQQEIGEEHPQGGHGRQFGAGVILGEMLVEDAFELDALKDPLEQWQGADVVGAQLESLGLGVFAGDGMAFGAASCRGGSLGQGLGFGHGKAPQGWPEETSGRTTKGPIGVQGRQDGKFFEGILLLELWRLLLT